MNIAAVKQAFTSKYDEQIRTISKEKEVDMGVAMDILVAHVRNRNKTEEQLSNTAYYYNFTGCEHLNYEELDEEIKVLEDNFIIPKVVG
jgi:DNA-directed RNA polymerase subunit F